MPIRKNLHKTIDVKTIVAGPKGGSGQSQAAVV